MIPRFGPTPRSDIKYRLRPGVYAILPHGGDLLLTFQESPVPELQLPGGGVDPGESPLAALHREVYEETGWSISAPRRLGAFRRFVFMPEYDFWAEKLCTIYMARPVRPLGPPTEPWHSTVWASPRVAARELGNSGDRSFVARFAV
ncbi:8-oxo-dGTP diphosphatase [Lutimaribacter pacificus]|uniref:8-oxo-dGTP diphosphatase n=1 Tax=Lutimaribacter pacificus TaxID=391948 RepID=A0A1H0EIQ9_9RHOB|nr:NUDIX hydrolase [Lutimaribacter pacificus]SDN82377.1 8-oxo-dGTP diphosphatase [Lutimaribacter pacificus]SHK52504.1 8-oxo-dGTP diphosphatase [Lutimaribacter pacificus]